MTAGTAHPVRIPITRPVVGEAEAAAAAEAVRSGWLTQGRRVQEFEEALAAYTGARHAIVVSNCTTALHLALVAAGIGGVRLRLGPAWLLELALRADQHFTDWTLHDAVSGAQAEFGDYLVRGVSLGVGYRF